MVKGLAIFRDFFRDFQNQYVLIGGAACDIILSEADLSFRATKDLDVVIVLEALTPEFGKRIWEFITEGGYKNKAKSNGTPQFYRFSEPEINDYPYMIELFTRSEAVLDNQEFVCRPLSISEEISSLSAILLNDDYYQLLSTGRVIIEDIPMLTHEYLVLFKAKAWLDLTEKRNAGHKIQSGDIKKHKNDVANLAVLFTGSEVCEIPTTVFNDIMEFTNAFEQNPPNMKALGITVVSIEEIVDIIRRVYIEKVG